MCQHSTTQRLSNQRNNLSDSVDPIHITLEVGASNGNKRAVKIACAGQCEGTYGHPNGHIKRGKLTKEPRANVFGDCTPEKSR